MRKPPLEWVPSILINPWSNSFWGCIFHKAGEIIFAYIQVSTQNVSELWKRICTSSSVSELWKRICASSSFWVENGIYPEPLVLHEQPSDGLKIVLAVWGMIRATKNPVLKISPQNFCQTCSAWNPNAWNSTGVSFSQKHHTSALVKKSKSKYSKHTLLQWFFELNLGWTETHENPHN